MIALSVLARLGAWTLGLLAGIGRFTIFALHALSHALRPPFQGREIGRTAYKLNAGQTKTYNTKVSRKPASKRKPLTVKYRVSSRAAADTEGKLKLVL